MALRLQTRCDFKNDSATTLPSISRRRFTLALAALGGMVLLPAFSSCSASNAASAMHIPPALDKASYGVALAKVQESAPDAVLVAVRLSHDATPGTPADELSWMYLFGSKEGNSTYTVFPGEDGPLAAAYGSYPLTEEEWAAIPDVSEITIDADAAYQAVIDQYADRVNDSDTCSAYLMTYIAEDADPTMDAMKWFFDFGFEDEPSNESDSASSGTGANEQADPDGQEDASETGQKRQSGEAGADGDAAEQQREKSYTYRLFAVDARTQDVVPL